MLGRPGQSAAPNLSRHPLDQPIGRRRRGGEHAAIRTEDGLAALDRDGLAHRQGAFAWAKHAAMRADELAPV
jgi:hypothetical protein